MYSSLCAAVAAILVLTGCAAAEPRPAGVPWRIGFSVSSVYPKSFEITAVGPRSFSTEKLKVAWQTKATLVANGHRFKTSPFVVHNTEDPAAGLPVRYRTVTATITLID